MRSFRPFALTGGGLLLDVPGGNLSSPIVPASTSTSAKGVFVYGGGVDWTVLPHMGLRLQYRGNLYRAPDLTRVFSSSGAFTHTAEPMLGVFFRF